MEGFPIQVRKGGWTEEEDDLLRKCIEKYGEGKWHQVPLKAGLNRCRKSCRLRWLNYLRPNIKRGNFTADEVDMMIRLHKLLGNRWSLIAGRLPGRTANDVKNYWNTHLYKKLKFQREEEKAEDQKAMKTEIIRPRPRTFSRNLHWQRGKNTINIAHTQTEENPTKRSPISPPWDDEAWWWDNNVFGKMGTKNEFACPTVRGGSAEEEEERVVPAGESSVQGSEIDWNWSDAVIDNVDLWDLLK